MKQFFSKFSRRTWIIIGIVAVILLAAVFVVRRNGNKQVTYQTAPITKGALVATVGATGSVRAQQSATLAWETTGTVDTVKVSVGDKVSSGDVLATLDKASLNQSVILAEADLANYQKALDDLVKSDTAHAQSLRDLDTAETNYKNAYDYRLSLNGKVDLAYAYLDRGVPRVRYVRGYADAETIKDADEKLDLAKAQLDDARRTADRLKNGADPADVAAAKARVSAAQATLDMAHIIAPFDGTVTQAEPVIGDQVSAGTVAFRVDDLSHLLVDVQVSEVDINNVAVGQDATLTFDAVLGKATPYQGKVVQVSQAGDTVQGVVNFVVTVELTDADEFVKPGMTAAVNIIIKEQKDAVLIPNRAVRLINTEQSVYLLVNNKPKLVKIQLGATDGINSALASGEVKEGDLIILNPPSANGGPFGG
jgi:HlyD family secretion protein